MTAVHIDQLSATVGTELGSSAWRAIDQARIDTFADATDDHQWIHVDPRRAEQGPYGATVAHGYLTLSLLPVLVQESVELHGVARRVNYGLDKVRFPAPVIVGSRVRVVTSARSVLEIEGGVQLALRCVIEIEGSTKPACVADTITLLFRETAAP